MKVLLKRDFNTKDQSFRRSFNGTDIPSVLDGKKVVAYLDWDGDESLFPLPDDAVILDPNDIEVAKDTKDRSVKMALGSDIDEDEPNTFSAMAKKTQSNEELIEKKAAKK